LGICIMESLEDFAERFRADVEKKCDCPVYKKALESKFNLHKCKEYPSEVFAHISRQKTLRRFTISAWEKDAVTAGVAHLACKRVPKGKFGKPSLHWYVKESDAESYKKAVNALSKICQVRDD